MTNDWLEEEKKRLDYELRWRKRFCRVITFGRHFWNDWNPIEVRCLDGLTEWELMNDVGFEPIGQMRQCKICYECKTK